MTKKTKTDERELRRDVWSAEADEAMRRHWTHDGCTEHADDCDDCFVQPMLVEIHHIWTTSRSNAVLDLIYSMQDGYGEIGYVPDQGYDWSGVRDSSPHQIREIWKAIHA